MSSQITDHIMMIRPAAFHRNAETAENNLFQPREDVINASQAQEKALEQFDAFVDLLRKNGISVTVFEDSIENNTPDSIFPNNWNSFHESGRVFLYPMYAKNRRKERRPDILEQLKENYQIEEVISLTEFESDNLYLEGTGSLILDRTNKIAYAAVSERTNPAVLNEFESKSGYKPLLFQATQKVGTDLYPIYHTNVMMCLGEKFSVICLDTIRDAAERNKVIESLEQSGKSIISITEEQMNHFAGNMLQLKNEDKQRFVVMSDEAFRSLEEKQIKEIEMHGTILHPNLSVIEKLGGGSARCMIAEIFLPVDK